MLQCHNDCIICGSDNPYSLGLVFNPDKLGNVHCLFRPGAMFQGYRGIIHGGILASLLDSAMTNCLFHKGIKAYTGELIIKYLRPVPCGEALHIEASIVSSSPPLHILRALISIDGKAMTRGEAKFMEQKK